MKQQGVKRVYCLLEDQLSFYESDLLTAAIAYSMKRLGATDSGRNRKPGQIFWENRVTVYLSLD